MRELDFLTPHAFWNITDFGAKCEKCETINMITSKMGNLSNKNRFILGYKTAGDSTALEERISPSLLRAPSSEFCNRGISRELEPGMLLSSGDLSHTSILYLCIWSQI
jgi:hypothetical protein